MFPKSRLYDHLVGFHIALKVKGLNRIMVNDQKIVERGETFLLSSFTKAFVAHESLEIKDNIVFFDVGGPPARPPG